MSLLFPSNIRPAKVLAAGATFEIRNSPNKRLEVFAMAPIPYAATTVHGPLISRYKEDKKPRETYLRFPRLPPSIEKAALELSVLQHEDRCMVIAMNLILDGEP